MTGTKLLLALVFAWIAGASTFIPAFPSVARPPLRAGLGRVGRGAPSGVPRFLREDGDGLQELRGLDVDESVRAARLKSQLQEAVEDEDYLEAARLKEQLQKLQRKSVKRMFSDSERAAESLELSSKLMAPRRKKERKGQLANSPKAMVLSDADRKRDNESPDAIFYEKPRYAMHYDMQFAVKLQALYKERLQEGSRVLDLGSSCATLLPEDMELSEVCGLGMNMDEMRENECLTHRVTHDLNESPVLPFRDGVFDAVLMSSVLSYLRNPEQVLAEVRRVLRPAGVVIITFTDRVWAEKATEGWKRKGNLGRCQLVQDCVRAAGGLTEPELVVDAPLLSPVGQLVPTLREACGGDPFLAVVSYKGTPPPGWAMMITGPGMVKLPLVNATVRALNITPFAAMYLLYIVLSHTFFP